MNKIKELAELTGTEVPESKPLFTIDPIPNTPFTIAKDDERAFLALGKYRLSEDYEDAPKVMDYFTENFWEILLKVITCVFTEMINQNENAKTNP